jgi:peptidoglycan/xylan/chitin deacetylase (PgdA/CDA1 family)|tara:strand:- start:1386 stop:2483 length:1098 start_codon:yes stop_codon:yes gene_type:complete
MIVNQQSWICSRLTAICLCFLPFSTACAADAVISHAVVLQYHHVDSSTPAVTSITETQFKRQMDHLKAENYRVLPLGELVSHLQKGEAIPDRAVSLTFDDAYESIQRAALPILKELAFPFTVFVSTQMVDSGHKNYLSWTQLRELQAAGGTIANHTQSHTHLLRRRPGETTNLWRNRIRDEILAAEGRIKSETGTATKLFAYPYGEFNDELKRLVGELGYTGFGQHSGPVGPLSDQLALPRFPIAGIYSDMAGFAGKIKTLPLPVLRQSSAHDSLLPQQLTTPTLTIELAAGDYRTSQLACYASGQGRIKVDWLTESTLTATAGEPLPVGRSRYNCTMPNRQGDRYYWYSQPWIRKKPDGSWYSE